MSVLQFSLFFIALLVGYVLVHLRLMKFEEHLQRLRGIESLDNRLEALAEALSKLKFERVEQQLDRLHEDLEDLREATGTVREAIVQIPTPEPRVVAPVEDVEPALQSSPQSTAARVLALVETRLLQLGYRNIEVLSDLANATENGDADVLVECEDGGMAMKGRVQVRNFGIRDVAVQSVAPMFP